MEPPPPPPPPPIMEAAGDLADALLLLCRARCAHLASALAATPTDALVAAALCGALLAAVVVPLILRPLILLLHPLLGLAPRIPPSYAQLVPSHSASQTTLAGRALALARRRLPFARRAVERAREELRAEVQASIRPAAAGAPRPLTSLPEKPTPHAEVLAMVRAREAKGPRLPTNGHAPFSGALYVRSASHQRLMNDVAAAVSLYANPLHGPGMFPAVRQMEAEVVAMTAALVGGGDGSGGSGGGGGGGGGPRRSGPRPPSSSSSGVCGLMTAGGTESIVTALKAARDFAVEQRGARAFAGGPPEIVASPTAHAAVVKGAEWLGMRLVWAQADADGRLRGVAVARVITRRTVLVYASAPSYPWGVVDDVRGIAAVARRWRCCIHVDACLGGFVLPFLDDDDDGDGGGAEGCGGGGSGGGGGGDNNNKNNNNKNNSNDNPGRRLPPASPYALPGAWDFRVPGVTSLSIDTHKYALAPKGSSVLLFSSPALRRHCFTAVTDWPGGVYVSPSLAGSRSGALIATAWASLVALGREGLRASARRAAAAAREFAARLQAGEVPGLEVLPAPAAAGGSGGFFVPDTTVVAFGAAAAPRRTGRRREEKGGAPSSPPPPPRKKIDIYRLNDLMAERGGWRLSALQRPPALHFCFTDASAECVGQLVEDLTACVAAEEARAAAEAGGGGGGGGMGVGGGGRGGGGSAPLYGALAVVPDRSIVGEALEVVQEVLLGV